MFSRSPQRVANHALKGLRVASGGKSPLAAINLGHNSSVAASPSNSGAQTQPGQPPSHTGGVLQARKTPETSIMPSFTGPSLTGARPFSTTAASQLDIRPYKESSDPEVLVHKLSTHWKTFQEYLVPLFEHPDCDWVGDLFPKTLLAVGVMGVCVRAEKLKGNRGESRMQLGLENYVLRSALERLRKDIEAERMALRGYVSVDKLVDEVKEMHRLLKDATR